MDSVALQILLKSKELFLQFGVKNLTMDDIARALTMSKKTIYQHFDNKHEIVMQCVKAHIQEESKEIETISIKSENALQEMLTILNYCGTHFKEFNTATFFELKKYYPEAFQIINEYRESEILLRIKSNIEKGIKEGLYRKEVHVDIISKIYIEVIEVLMNQAYFPSKTYNFYDLQQEFITYHLHGILSAKGLKNFDLLKVENSKK